MNAKWVVHGRGDMKNESSNVQKGCGVDYDVLPVWSY